MPIKKIKELNRNNLHISTMKPPFFTDKSLMRLEDTKGKTRFYCATMLNDLDEIKEQVSLILS